MTNTKIVVVYIILIVVCGIIGLAIDGHRTLKNMENNKEKVKTKLDKKELEKKE